MMEEGSMIGIGIIGYGYWGPNLVRNFADLPGARIVAVSDLRRDRLATLNTRYPTVRTTTDYRDLLADPAVDAVVIATPVSTHFTLAMQALQAGKHVLVEKPLAASVEEGECLIKEAACRGLILMVDHTFLYTGAVRKIKELIDSRELGQLYYYDSVRLNLGLFQHDVNVMWDLAVHDLSIMDYLLGMQPRTVTATAIAHIHGRPEDIAYITCAFDGGLIAHFHVNWLAPVKIRRTLIGGDRRMVVFDDLEPSEKVKVYDCGITLNNGGADEYQMLVGYRTGDVWAPHVSPLEALRVEAEHFLECIEYGRCPLSDGHAGLRVMRILDAASRSLAAGGQVVVLEQEQVLA
jgi:predicted dehydrogenase